jgi:hypothetical protein
VPSIEGELQRLLGAGVDLDLALLVIVEPTGPSGM